ncbi:hypothetical protein IJS77_04275 [bacterium]|nr:hypothetical protein [bacterium]
MKIEKLHNQEEVTTERTMSSEMKDGEQSDFQTILNENAMNNFIVSSQGLNLIQTDLTMDFDTLSISQSDALFFNELVKNPQFSIGIEQNRLINLGELASTNDIQAYKSMEVSKGLFNLINKARDTQKPVRLDFDNNVTVIMKVDKEGKITAEFIPGDKAVEAYLRNNIPFLKQKFEEQNIVYNDLYYRQNSREQRQRNYKGESEDE